MRQILIAAALIMPASTAALAADADHPTSQYRIRVGLGAQLQPKYPGADEDEVGVLPHLSLAKGDEPFRFQAPDDSLAIPVISSGGFELGPSANLVRKRTESDVGARVGKVGTTIEVGGFANYNVGDWFRFRGELRKGIGGHHGLIGQVGFDGVLRDGDKYVLSLGPRLMFSDSRYQRAYFGVTPAVALATGLPTYRPGGGVHSVALASGAEYQLNSRLGLFGYARYERLIGDAARSPIVRDYGSRNQLSGGLGVSYIFTVRR